MTLHLFLAATHAVGLIAICTIAYGWIQRRLSDRLLRRCAIGCVLGLGAVLSMLQPYIVADGLQVDGHNMFLAIATAFGGALATIIAGTIAGIARILIGGSGVGIGVATMILVCVMAAIWAYLTRGEKQRSLGTWFLLGAILSLPLLISMLILDIAEPGVAVTRVATDMIGALVFGKMFESEMRRGRRERQLNLDASTDPLTGLPNRRAMMAFIDQLKPIARDRMALLIIDADHFKAINDTHGHDIGDEVLKRIARALTSAMGEGDFAARFGGEEFAVLLRLARPGDGYALADRMRLALSGQHDIAGHKVMVTVSIGGAALPAGDTDFQAAYARADAALYDAKRLGRDRTVFA